MQKLDPFYDYYQRELNYLRYSGAHFAQQHPKIARRLDFTGAESADPHVERLLESFAYLTARLQRDIDDQFPRFSEALLNVLYPQFVHPVPSFTIARFIPQADGAKATTHTVFERGTPLFTRTNDGTVCRFRTVYPLELPPVEIVHVEIVSSQNLTQVNTMPPQLLHIRLKSLAGNFNEMCLNKLRLYIAGNRFVKPILMESLLTAEGSCYITTQDSGLITYPHILKHVGFDEEESVLPYPPQVLQGYQLLFEHFHFPEKFYFIDFECQGLSKDAPEMDIYLPLNSNLRLNSKDIGTHNVLLGCTPIVNLFTKMTEPLALNHRNHEYRLVADQRLERSTEIHSIQEVVAAVEGQGRTENYVPYFSFNHTHSHNQNKTFWTMRRSEINQLDIGGTDVHLSFVDFNFDPTESPKQTIYAKVLCTNRQLASHIPPGSFFHFEEASANHQVICLDRPSTQTYPAHSGQELWRLISHLSLNHLALSGGSSAAQALKEIIGLYIKNNDQDILPEIEALQTVTVQKVTRRIREEAWRGFVQGTKITLTFDTSNITEGNIFILCSILNHFFSLLASVNTFTQLEVRRNLQEGVWLTWPPVIGNKVLV